MGNILIYGGTFNPIHKGHIHFLKSVSEILKSKKSIIVPSGKPSHKTSFNMASFKNRMEMCRLATEGISNVEVSNYEDLKPCFCYTSDTIGYFKSIYPDDNLFLLLGSDNFLSIDRWHGAEKILSEVTLCTSVRKETSDERVRERCDRYIENGYKAMIMDIDTIDISSTKLRATIRAGQSLSELIPSKVINYIIRNNLYKQEEHSSLLVTSA